MLRRALIMRHPSFAENETFRVEPPIFSQTPADMLPYKNGKLLLERQDRLSDANVLKMVLDPIRYTVSHV